MTTLRDLLLIAAEHLPVWRDAAVMVLALVVLACLWLASEAAGS